MSVLRSCPALLLIIFLICAGGAAEADQDDVRASLFEAADAAINEARKQQADLIAPKNFGRGMEAYKKAESAFKKGKGLEGIRKDLKQSVKYFSKATEATQLAGVVFKGVLEARRAAFNAEAQTFVAPQWTDAEARFKKAAIKLEEGKATDARRAAPKIEQLFRQAELDAIKADFLNEPKKRLLDAKANKMDQWTPTTLALAQSLLEKAESKLEENRYDTDPVWQLVEDCRRQLDHAQYLSERIRTMETESKTFEEVILDAEERLQTIAGKLDLTVSFENGLDEATEQIVQQIGINQHRLRNLNVELDESKSEVNKLQSGVSLLQEQVQEQEEARQTFLNTERLFNRSEAQVLREGELVLIRLFGLSCAEGKSTIEPEFFNLLTKVRQAIRLYPGAQVSVEGHSDSFGPAEGNLKLSTERAESVRQYLMANMNLEDTRIGAMGYGESRPIASNDSKEGRAKNRRIEVIIKPN